MLRQQSERWWAVTLNGVVALIVGVVTLLWPGITSLALLWLVAAWALAKGILQIVIAVRYREHLARTWLLVLAGAVSLILGIVYVLFPGAGILSLVWLLGIFAIVYGGALIARGLLLRDVNRAFKGEARADT